MDIASELATLSNLKHGMDMRTVEVTNRLDNHLPGQMELLDGKRVTAHRFQFAPLAEVEFKWASDRDYLAIHDIRLSDGETQLSHSKPIHLPDLTDRLTFLPKGCDVSGWSQLRGRRNSFTSVSMDISALLEDETIKLSGSVDRPLLYFQSFTLQQTLRKIERELKHRDHLSTMALETLALTASVELVRHLNLGASGRQSGRLTARQLRLLDDYIAANLHRDLGLAELSSILGLSPYHFSRCFKLSVGKSPYQYLLARRIEAARVQLANRGASISQIANALGFASSSQFARLFRRAVGLNPSDYRDEK